MSDHLENEMQPSETTTPQELREALLTELETARQEIAELSNEQLEEVVGGGWLSYCTSCVKPETKSPAASPPRSYKLIWETLDAMSPGASPRLSRSTSSPGRTESSPFNKSYPTELKLSAQVKNLMNHAWKARND